MTARQRSAAWLAMLLLASAAANAHTRSESYSNWYIDDGVITGTVTIPLREVMLLYQVEDAATPPRELFRRQLQDNVAVSAAGAPCKAGDASILNAASGFVRIELAFDCGPATPDLLQYRALFGVAPGHVHYARIFRGGTESGEYLLTDTADNAKLAAAAVSPSLLAFLRLGIEHIAGGADHIAFLLGLLLIAGSAGRAIVAVTGFTLGHSLSLAAAVLGYIRAESQLVEAFIGFTVMLVAVEYFLLSKRNVRAYAAACLALALVTAWAAAGRGSLDARSALAYAGFGVFAAIYILAAPVAADRGNRGQLALMFAATACFGVIHGFGFAGFLMDTGMLGESLFLPLLGFNAGVEIGQLLLVGAALAVALLAGRRLPERLPDVLAAVLCGIGIFWFVGRSLG